MVPLQTVETGERERLLRSIELHRVGKLQDAIAGYRRILADNPGQFDAQRLLGAALLADGQYAVAADALAAALRISTTALPEVWVQHGEALAGLGRPLEARASLERALALAPARPRTWISLGLQWLTLRRFEDALGCFDRALTLDPELGDAWSNRGTALQSLGRLQEALASYQRAATASPNAAEILCNLGQAQLDLQLFEQSLASYVRATTLAPGSEQAWRGKAASLTALGRFSEALESCDQALRCAAAGDPAAVSKRAEQNALLLFNRGLLQLTLGNYAAGWEGFEFRRLDGARQAVPTDLPLWQRGESLAGRTILLTHEQGLGDTLQFCRFAPHLAQTGAKVILRVQPTLAPLLASLRGIERVEASDQPASEAHRYCPLPSIPHRLGIVLESFPRFEPYLAPSPYKAKLWQERLGKKGKLRVGLVCSGNHEHRNDRARSIPLHCFAPLRHLDVQWHLLQRQLATSDEALLKSLSISDHREDLQDFAETAALAANMDIVVSVDTSVAHLVGAMGGELLVLLPFVPDWRWLTSRLDSPWYPTAQLFRQSTQGDWNGPIERIGAYLSDAIARRTPERLVAHP